MSIYRLQLEYGLNKITDTYISLRGVLIFVQTYHILAELKRLDCKVDALAIWLC